MGDDLEKTKKDLEVLGESTKGVAEKVAEHAAKTTRKVIEGAGEGLLGLSEKMKKKEDDE